MSQFDNTLPFRLSTGGLFYRLMLRLRLVEESEYHPWRRITLFIALTWLPLMILTAIDGNLTRGSVNITFFRDSIPHVRYLIALPLLIFADWIIDPYMTAIVKHFQVSNLVPKDAKCLFSKALNQLILRRDAAWVDVVLIGLAFGLVWIIKFQFGISTLEIKTSSWMMTASGEVEKPTLAGWWLMCVSIPFIQFIFYRWIWRLIIWVSFMNRISHLDLAIHSKHPDRVGGLGLLISAQFSFGVIFTAVGSTESAKIANVIIHLGSSLSAVYVEIIGFVFICFAIIAGPLCTFSSPLSRAKRHDLRHYSAKAMDPAGSTDDIIMYETISRMRQIPMNGQEVIGLFIILGAPFIPLIFTQFSIEEILRGIVQSLV